MSGVSQFITHKEIKRRLAKVGAPQCPLAFFADISEGLLSQVLAGRKMLSEPAQINIDKVLYFFEWVAERADPVPVDFSNVTALVPLFKEYKKLHSEDEVVRTKAETA